MSLPAPTALKDLTPQQIVKQISTADWGRKQEGHIVAKEKAAEVYEEIVRGKIDPALLGIRRRQHLQRPRLSDPGQGVQSHPHRL